MREIQKLYILSRNIIAVAVINYKEDMTLFDWAAYIDAVPGHDHTVEMQKVADDGSKVKKDLACKMFPFIDATKYRL